MWQATNLNKRDITLDLASDEGRDLARSLVRDADVVVENFSPGWSSSSGWTMNRWSS